VVDVLLLPIIEKIDGCAAFPRYGEQVQQDEKPTMVDAYLACRPDDGQAPLRLRQPTDRVDCTLLPPAFNPPVTAVPVSFKGRCHGMRAFIARSIRCLGIECAFRAVAARFRATACIRRTTNTSFVLWYHGFVRSRVVERVRREQGVAFSASNNVDSFSSLVSASAA